MLPEAVRLGVFDVGLVPVNYTMASNKALLDAIDHAAKAGMGVVAMKTQAGGLARPDRALPKELPPHSQTALLKWVLHNPSITTAIPGVTAYDQLEQNITVAFDLEYSAAEKAFLGDRALMTQARFCQQCGQCRTDCQCPGRTGGRDLDVARRAAGKAGGPGRTDKEASRATQADGG